MWHEMATRYDIEQPEIVRHSNHIRYEQKVIAFFLLALRNWFSNDEIGGGGKLVLTAGPAREHTNSANRIVM